MTTLQEALPCPFCGKQHTLQVISGQELMGEDQEFWQHSESFGVVCDASTPGGKGGCGAMGGFKPTEDEAIEAWNTRTALSQQELPQKERPDFMAGYDADMADAKRMAQQGEPVAYITETEQGPMVWTPEMYGEACTYCDDGEFPVPLYTVTALRSQVEYLEKIVEDHAKALAQHREQQPVCHGCGIPAGDVHMSTCKSGKWPSRVSNRDTAAPAPQAQEPARNVTKEEDAILRGALLRSGTVIHPKPAPQPVQWESLNLAREVLKLNALWNKSTVQAPAISDQLGICRVLAERVNTDD